MIVAYLAHQLFAPTRKGIEKNRSKAAQWAAWLCLQGVSPVCSWIVLTGVLEETPKNRAIGLACDCAQVERCDVTIHVGPSISSGMQMEADHGVRHGVPVIDLIGLNFDEAEIKLEEWLLEYTRQRDTLPAPATSS